MENIATKKFTYDHVSSYKARGRLGVSNRNVRAQRASENRHQSRMDEATKRRRIPLSPLADDNVVDAVNSAVESKKYKQKDTTSQSELSRREKLLKWREERTLKKGNELQKKSFVVRHVKHDNDASLFTSAMNKAKKAATLIKPSQFAVPVDKPAKQVTRASARIAKQASSNVPTDLKNHSAKKTTPKSKATASDKIKGKVEVKTEKTGRVTRQSVRTEVPPAGKGGVTSQPNKVAPEPKNQVKTRSQVKKQKDLPPSEMCHSKPDIETEQTTPSCEKANFPALEAIKNTVSVGRGSSEGVDRAQSCLGSENEAPSFAPADFQFTAPSGVNTFNYFSKTFKFQPLSPNSASEFMFPTSAASFFSPKKPAEKKENPILEDPVAVFNKSIASMENEKQQSVDANAETETCNIAKETCNEPETCSVAMETCNEPEKHQAGTEVTESENTACLSGTVNPDTRQQSDHELAGEMDTGMESGNVMETQDVDDEQHDATYFRNLVKNETDRLNEICAKWEKISAEEQNLSEEVTGQIRTTIGQGQLLIDQRFRQFSGLIDLSEDKNAEKPATASDLQGFWEMIYFQVEDVNAKFDALEKLKGNNWQEEEKKAKKVIRKTKAKKPTAGDNAKASSKASASRNRIQEMRMAMKAKMAADKEKLKSEKRHQEEEAFVTILTPVKKSKKNDDTDEVVLTPVRRSIRKTPQKRSALKNTPVVTTPKIISEDSPGLRLTPDNANIPNELTVIGTGVEAEETREETTRGETSEEDARRTGIDLQLKEDEMECDLGQKSPVAKSASKSTVDKSRRTPGKVTFQSPAEFGDQQITPEYEDNAVATPVSLAQVNSPAVSPVKTDVSDRKASASKRFSARKCRGRVSTPARGTGIDLQLKEDEMECDLGQKSPVAKSASKSTVDKSRKTPSKVTFQSPAEFGDQQMTPEYEDNAVATPLSLAQVNSPAVSPTKTDVSDRKASASKRFSARKCRGRVSTPYHQNGPRRRVSTVDEGVSGQSEGQTSSDSDGSDAKAKESCPRSGLRRSLRRTPSKYRETIALEPETDQGAKTPSDISVKLFHATEESTTCATPREDTGQVLFSKYLCPSSSDEEECAKKSESSDHVAENVFDEETKSEDCPVNTEVTLTPPEGGCPVNTELTLTPPEEPENFLWPAIPNSNTKTGRTPIHILGYLSDMDTPSPNSRQITPMPKTTIFMSPSGTSKTPALANSLGMMSPENVVLQFPAQSEASPLLPLVGVAGKESQCSVTSSSRLATFHLDSPVNEENRRDSVFFAPPPAAESVGAQDNLMCFSPVVEGNEEEQE